MTRQLEAVLEARQSRELDRVYRVVYGGLSVAVKSLGAELTGFSVKFGPADCLMVLKADFEGRPMVAFVGGEDFARLLVKAERGASHNELRWKEDRWD